MLSLLCLLQLPATVPIAPAPFDSGIPQTSSIAVSGGMHFESFAPALPAPTWSIAGTMPVDTPRTVAIEYSDGYYTRLTIHRYASYTMIPLFVLQYLSGERLIKNPDEHSWARSVHGPLAAGVGVLFGVNTVTGIWSLHDSRKDPNGRTRRTVHSLLMLAADAGFVLTGVITPDHEEGAGSSKANLHRTLAITSGSVALLGDLMMLIWKD